MITTKSCSTCKHFPNDHHCVGCVWDESKGENTKWELKVNPIVIERAVLDKIRAEICKTSAFYHGTELSYGLDLAIKIVDKYKESEESNEQTQSEEAYETART